jgi:hypothetical protein
MTQRKGQARINFRAGPLQFTKPIGAVLLVAGLLFVLVVCCCIPLILGA